MGMSSSKIGWNTLDSIRMKLRYILFYPKLHSNEAGLSDRPGTMKKEDKHGKD